MNILGLVAAVESGGRIEEIASTFGVDWPHLIAQIVSFCIVCVLLHRFAYKPVLKMLEQRRQQIVQSLADQEKITAELAQTETRRHEILLKAEAEASKLIEEARAAAARVEMQETQKAMGAAKQIVEKAREAAEQEHARMLAELKRDVGRLVIQTTATVAGKILTAEDQLRMAEETVRRLSAAA